jgi:hypothetical protein
MSHLSVAPAAELIHHPFTASERASVTPIDEARCALCGTSLVGKRERYRLLSPFASMGKVTVCRTCRKASLSEGYRPVV